MTRHIIMRSLAALAFTISGTVASAATVTQSFTPVYNFDDGPGSVAFTLAGLDPNIESDLSIDFTFFGDLNGGNETFELFLDGTSYGVGCDNNTGNGNFGDSISFGNFTFGDFCSQNTNSLTDANLLVSAVDAVGLLADGALEIAFNFSAAVNDFVDITNGGETRSGVFFGNANNASFGAGGTITYVATDLPAPIPLPASVLMLLAACGGLAALRKRRQT